MIFSFLITGGDATQRKAQAFKIITSVQDQNIPNPQQNPDITILQEEKSIKVAQIRKIIKKLQLKPISLPYKTIIILEAEKLTHAAQNTLLKTLEEPPGKSLIVLTSNFPEQLLPTIISRCQIKRLNYLPKDQLTDQNLAQNIQKTKKILTMSPGKRIILAQKIAENENNILQFLSGQTRVWRNLIRKNASSTQAQPLKNLKQMLFVLRQIQNASTMIDRNVNPKLVIEDLLLKYPKI